MKTFRVSYYLGNMRHSYLIEAGTRADAYVEMISKIPTTSIERLNNIKIEEYIPEWN